jgi:hypothetical protein
MKKLKLYAVAQDEAALAAGRTTLYKEWYMAARHAMDEGFEVFEVEAALTVTGRLGRL